MKQFFIRIKKEFHNDFWLKMVKNVLAIFSGKGIAAALYAIIVLLISSMFPAEIYGCFVIGQTYMGAIDLVVNFQCWNSVIRYGTFALESNDKHKLLRIIKAGLIVDLSTCIGGFFIGLAMVRLIGHILNWSETIQIICVLFSFEILFHVEGTITGILRLFDKFKNIAIYTAVSAVLK